MSVLTRTRVAVLTGVVVIAASVSTVTQLQHNAAETSVEKSRAADQMLEEALEQETAISGFALTGRQGFIAAYRTASRDFDAAQRKAAAGAVDDSEKLHALDAQVAAIRRWQNLAELYLARARGSGSRELSPRTVVASRRLFGRFGASNNNLQELLGGERQRQLQRASLISHVLVGVLCLLLLLGYLMIERLRRSDARRREGEEQYQDTQADFTQAMQVTRSENEAYVLLKRHLERSIDQSEVVVLNRNNSDNRLEAVTALTDQSPLRETLRGAEPNSCLAMRLASLREGGGRESLIECEVCCGLPGKSTCIPSLVGGEVIGSVLVRHSDRLQGEQMLRLRESVTQAAPVLANLRNLELAKVRAATDALTGLGNVRTVRETLKRIVAQSGRTVTPMSVLLIDLDHFKRINDTQGHAKGDEVLAAVGDVLSSQIRDSDFVGRYGGEEFVAVLPATDQEGAASLAEKLRRAISEISVSALDRPVTASFGVSSYPAHAADADALLRLADRALYAAKEKGRNRVEVAKGATAVEPSTEALSF